MSNYGQGFNEENFEKQEELEEESYKIGFKKPPKHTQFKKGQSGNPKGRPKLKKSFKEDLQEELYEIITIYEAGKAKITTKQRAMIKRLTTAALNGDMKAIRTLTQYISSYSKDDENSEPEELSIDDLEIIQQFLERGNSNE